MVPVGARLASPSPSPSPLKRSLQRARYDRPVRKLIKIALVVFGIRAFLRWRRSRHQQETGSSAAPPPPDPADELRRKLAESRDEGADQPAAASVADRRADVHEQGRAALDEMTASDES